jgi:amino acid transporter
VAIWRTIVAQETKLGMPCQNLVTCQKFKLLVVFSSQPRILMSMARDGLFPPFFSDVNRKTQVPVKSTIATGICAAALAFAMDVSQLAGMVRNLACLD